MRSLQVHTVRLLTDDHHGDFASLRRLPLLAQLTFLALHNVQVLRGPFLYSFVRAKDLASGLSLLTQLCTLQLSQMCMGADVMEVLPLAPALRRLLFLPLPVPARRYRGRGNFPPPDGNNAHQFQSAASPIALHVFLPREGADGLSMV
jgi:hypothetical protein